MVADAGLQLVLTQTSLRERLPQTVRVLMSGCGVDHDREAVAREPGDECQWREPGVCDLHVRFDGAAERSAGAASGRL